MRVCDLCFGGDFFFGPVYKDCFVFPQTKYKEAGKKEVNTCLYSLLPETLETQHAKEAGELLSEVKSSFKTVFRFEKLRT